MEEIEAERLRQVDEEGWTSEHDDAHSDGSLLRAAVIYYQRAAGTFGLSLREDGAPLGWPWDKKWWKPRGRRRDLVRAGALCLAEKDRLRRLASRTSTTTATNPVDQKLYLIVQALEATDRWIALAERLLAIETVREVSDLAREFSVMFIARRDYPAVGTLAARAVDQFDVDAAIELIRHLFPGWGMQVGVPLTCRSPSGWYASIFRERRTETFMSRPLEGMYRQDSNDPAGRGPMRYAAAAAPALLAALCRVLAEHAPGTSAIGEERKQ
jgi:hypothetical protein